MTVLRMRLCPRWTSTAANATRRRPRNRCRPGAAPRTERRRRLVRHPGAPRERAALGLPPRARRRARVVGGAQGPADRSEGESAGRTRRGPSARIRQLRRSYRRWPVRRGQRQHLGFGHLCDREMDRPRGQGRPRRWPGSGPVRVVPDRRQELDDAPHGRAGRARTGSRFPISPISWPRCARWPATLPRGPGWAYEMAWSGVRAVSRVEGGRIEVFVADAPARGDRRNVADRFPELRAMAEGLGTTQLLLDGVLTNIGAGRCPRAACSRRAADRRGRPGPTPRRDAAHRLPALRSAASGRPVVGRTALPRRGGRRSEASGGGRPDLAGAAGVRGARPGAPGS